MLVVLSRDIGSTPLFPSLATLTILSAPGRVDLQDVMDALVNFFQTHSPQASTVQNLLIRGFKISEAQEKQLRSVVDDLEVSMVTSH